MLQKSCLLETTRTLRHVLNSWGHGIWLSERQNSIAYANSNAVKKQNNNNNNNNKVGDNNFNNSIEKNLY